MKDEIDARIRRAGGSPSKVSALQLMAIEDQMLVVIDARDRLLRAIALAGGVHEDRLRIECNNGLERAKAGLDALIDEAAEKTRKWPVV